VTRYGRAGKVDRSFGRDGTYSLDAGLEDAAEAVAVQPDGTIVVAGQARCPAKAPGCGYETRSTLVLLRLSPGGRLLSRVERKLGSPTRLGLAIGADGGIRVATEAAGRNRPARLIAFTRGGRPATGFGEKGSVPIEGNLNPTTLTAAPGGDLLFSAVAPAVGYFIHRLLPDGSPDESFGEGGKVLCAPIRNQYVEEGDSAVAPLPDGKVLVSGDCALARYLPNGTLDPSFGADGRVEAPADFGLVEAIAAGPGETALVLRWKAGAGFRLARYLADGSIDRGFGDGGVATVRARSQTFDQVNALVPLPHREVLAVGTSQCGDWSCGEFALARYRGDGKLDPTFGQGGKLTTKLDGEGLATSAAIAPDGGIVVAGAIGVRAYGELHQTRPTLARYKRDGPLDQSFGNGGIVTLPEKKGEDVQFNGVAIAPDGDIVAVGEASCTQEEECGKKRYCSECGSYVVARFHPHGGLDRAFGKGGVLRIDVGHNDEDHDAARAVAVQPDGKIIVAGRSYPGDFGVVRLLPDGRRDPTFGERGIVRTFFHVTLHDNRGKPFAIPVGRRAYALALLPGGKLLVAGGNVVPIHEGRDHPSDHGVVVRYLADGRVDPSFGRRGIAKVEGLAIRALGVDSCGRAVVAGPDSAHHSPVAFGAARLLPSGALDRSFADPTVRLPLGTGLESHANALAFSGENIILGGVAANDGAGDDFTLAALRAGHACR
jgi:uncharacterized delta-60 repeat protein